MVPVAVTRTKITGGRRANGARLRPGTVGAGGSGKSRLGDELVERSCIRGVESMTPVVEAHRCIRWVAAFAMTLALLAAMLPAFGQSVAAQEDGSPEGPSATGTAAAQVWTCPLDYSGTDFLVDCAPGGATYEVVMTYPNATTLSDTTGGDGFTTFAGGDPGAYQFALQVPGDFASFYYACFDEADVFQFDGSANVIDFVLEAGDSLFCRWYVIPENAGGETPSPSAAPSDAGSSAAAVQVYICPTDYTGDDYLTDCEPTDTQIPVSINPGTTYDESQAVSALTEVDGFVTFEGLTPGEYTLALGVPGDFASFYYACFDVTFGSEVFVKSGDTNTLSFIIEQGGDLSCRWYVIPEDARGEGSPSASASATPKPSAAASRTPGAVTGLPSTGTGDAGDGTIPATSLVLLLGLATVVTAGVARRVLNTR